MYEGYNNSLPLNFIESPELFDAYRVVFENYRMRLSGEPLPQEGLPQPHAILVLGYGINYFTARQIAERAHKDVCELLDLDSSVGTLDT